MARGFVEAGDVEGFPLEILQVLGRGGDPQAREEAARITTALRHHADSGNASAVFREHLYRILAHQASGEEADSLQRQAMELAEAAAGGDPVRLAGMLSDHARICEGRAAVEDATGFRRRAVALLETGPPRLLARELVALAALRGCVRDYPEGLDLVERACGLYRSEPVDRDREHLLALERRVGFLERLGRRAEEVAAREEALRLERIDAGPRGFLAGSLDLLACARERLGDYQGALEAWRQAEQARIDHETEWWGGAPPSPEEARRARFGRSLGTSRCLAVLGKPAEAMRMQLSEARSGVRMLEPHLAGLAVVGEAAGLPLAGTLGGSLLRLLPWPHEELAWRALEVLAGRRGRVRLAERARAEIRRLEQLAEENWRREDLVRAGITWTRAGSHQSVGR